MIGIIGCGNVGFSMALAMQHRGQQILCYDISSPQKEKVAASCGHSAVANDLVDLRECQVIFECVPTEPQDESGRCDLSILESVVRDVSTFESLPDSDCRVFVQRSTCPPGTARKMARCFSRLAYVVNPSFLAKDTQLQDSLNPVRVAVGGPASAVATVVGVYDGFPDLNIVTSESWEAIELLKYLENVTDAVLISLWNEFLDIADAVGIPSSEFVRMTEALTERPRFATTLRAPGRAFGLDCLPKDIAALAFEANERGVNPATMRGAIATNERLALSAGTNGVPASQLLSYSNRRIALTDTARSLLRDRRGG